MVGDMFFMHELRSIFGPQYRRFIMAFSTFSLWDMAIPSYHIDMTLLTGHPSGDILPVIEIPTFYLDIPFWLNVTGITTSNGTRNTLFLPSWTSPVKVTNKTVGFVNGEMQSLNKLGMTRSASKPHSPS
jgi:hypothetical protein